MATLNDEDQKIIACGANGEVYLCADLVQVRNTDGTWDLKLKSTDETIDTVALFHPDVEEA